MFGLAVVGCTAASTPTTFMGAVEWTAGEQANHAISGLELSDDGGRFVAINDGGWIMRGQLRRDADGVLTGVTARRARRIGADRDRSQDSEGIALSPGGRIHVSFEDETRVARVVRGGPPRPLPRHPDFARLDGGNRGLEALARHPGGDLITLPERVPPGRTGFPIYRFDGATWRIAAELEPRDGFVPVGADIDDDGRLYVLERKFRILGFASRVRRLSGPEFGEVETLLTTAIGTHDNLEGLAVWRDARGTMRVTMVSDDNFLRFQRTEFVEYRVPV